jgi:siderophore synthetase component
MMPIYKYWIIYELEIWAETFNNNYPDHMEEVIEEEKKGYDYIHYLIDKFKKNECSKDDYENILFHIWQIKYDS